MIGEFSIPLSNEKMSAFVNMINVVAEVINPMAVKFFGSSQDALVGQRWFHFLDDPIANNMNIFLNWKHNKKRPLSHVPKEVVLTRVVSTCLEADL